MNIDSHQHFWKYNHLEYGWIGEGMSLLKRDFMPAHLVAELSNAGMDGTIAVQARQNLVETEWLLDLAEENPVIKGVVGWVDLCSPDIGLQLLHFSFSPYLVGVRHVIHDEPDDFMSRSDFQHGISLLNEYGLTYDLLLFPRHLPAASDLVSKFPEQIFILDHLAKPNIRENQVELWKSGIIKLAGFPNVFCKLSGMVTEAVWNEWDQSTFTPYLDVAFEAFGASRLMIGSDWPVCLLGGEYDKVLGIVRNYISQFDRTVQNKILGENSIKIYNLKC